LLTQAHEQERIMRSTASRRSYSLQNMMDDDRVENSWVVSESFQFYVRKGRFRSGQGGASFIKPCLMVANVGFRTQRRPRGQQATWQMIRFMRQVEAYAAQCGYSGVFVECVYNEKLRPLLKKHDYTRLPGTSERAPSYFRPTASILASARHRPSAIQTLPRPSLRRFLHTPDIQRFWLREQHENITMLIRRDRIDAPATPARTLRLTVVDLHHYKVDGAQPDHTLYWSADDSQVERFLKKLERRLAREGVRQLAIDARAICTAIKTEYGSTTIGVEHGQAGRRMRELGYCTALDANGGHIYLKSLADTRA
jgi:hypothetical protein